MEGYHRGMLGALGILLGYVGSRMPKDRVPSLAGCVHTLRVAALALTPAYMCRHVEQSYPSCSKVCKPNLQGRAKPKS